MVDKLDIRPSPIAGQWYPADPGSLAVQVDGYLDDANLPDLEGDILGVMAPHAGYIFSGPVAGYAFSALRGLTPEVVAVVSPMHNPYYEPVITTSHAAYATPLGAIPVDQEALVELDECLFSEHGIRMGRVSKDEEHSLEIELPFLQRALGKPFRLIPVMVRDQTVAVARALGQALARVESQPMLVASTDLSHLYPQSLARALDAEMLRQVETFDPEGVIQTEELGKGFACGRGAVSAVMWAARDMGANHARVLHYATSGDVTGDYNQVVGYGAAVFVRRSV